MGEENAVTGFSLKLSLLENAYDSFNESLMKAEQAEDVPSNWKYAVLHLVHSIELVLKERLRREHRLFIYSNVDKPNHTVSLEGALTRLQVIDVDLDKRDVVAIDRAIKWRNQIIHYEVDMHVADVRENYLLLFDFLDHFHGNHFDGGISGHVESRNRATAARMFERSRREIIEFVGAKMHRSWPSKLLAAQRVHSVSIEGRDYRRIAWGSESYWSEPEMRGLATLDRCRDCACKVGEFHGPGCCVERCPRCGDQFTYCDCDFEDCELWDLLEEHNETSG
ncbi:hypothetical protein LRS71_09085 [Rhodococcus pyridinivorans]|uniref:hypothetical protein n=1 Tax=Rhodococcus pyridinivorans TaxID=103816 RepID=UPI001E2A59F0|nr:hypothetical protein [Rhodococcus pyridinivorans]MCD5419709.1 hypothetical protein [Rhodococcus pyridinivorans]